MPHLGQLKMENTKQIIGINHLLANTQISKQVVAPPTLPSGVGRFPSLPTVPAALHGNSILWWDGFRNTICFITIARTTKETTHLLQNVVYVANYANKLALLLNLWVNFVFMISTSLLCYQKYDLKSYV